MDAPALRWAVVLAIYAHQGGWDEILFVLVPLVLFAVLLMVARRRVDQADLHQAAEDQPDGVDAP